MNTKHTQTGNTLITTLVIIGVVVLLGALGFIFWNNFLKAKTSNSTASQQSSKESTSEKSCDDKENTSAENGTFCSKEIGIKFSVPTIFVNKLAKVESYEVFQGPLDFNIKKSAGFSEAVYRATISGNDNFIFTIAQEPLRTGYVDMYHALQNTYYDQATGELTRVKTPTYQYDSATDTSTKSGDFSKGEVVPSFKVGDVRFFKGSDGDAGQVEYTYFAVIKNKIVKISLKNMGHMGDPAGDPTTIDASKVFKELDEAVKKLRFV